MDPSTPIRLLSALALLTLTSCQVWPITSQTASDSYAAEISIMRAEASLVRVADENGEAMGEDFFLLRTQCLLRVDNRSGKAQSVMSQFGSAFDDLRLRVRDEKGRKLATTTHTLWSDPLLEGHWFPLQEGLTDVELTSATLVGPAFGDRDGYPLIVDQELTQTIQLEYFGGFPGSDLSRAIQSNRVTVKIADRTAEVPRKPLPIPHV